MDTGFFSLNARFHKCDDTTGVLQVLSFAPRSAELVAGSGKLTSAWLRLALEQSERPVLQRSQGNNIACQFVRIRYLSDEQQYLV